MKAFLLFQFLFTHLALHSQPGFLSTQLIDREISKYKFDVLSNSATELTVQYEDRREVNKIVFSQTTSNTVPSTAEVKIEFYTGKGKSFRPGIVINEKENCDQKIFSVSFIPHSVSVTDIDLNGLGEVCFLYQSVCQADTSPYPVFLVLYEDGVVYKIHGESLVEMPSGNLGGDYTLDEKMKGHPLFSDFAVRRWKKFVLKN